MAQLAGYLRARGDVFDSQDGAENRRLTIEKLHTILKAWVIETGASKSPPVDPKYLAEGGGVQLKIFGSTRLGVHTPDADIDVLCLAPCWITRADFFSSFVDELRARHDVFTVSAVPEAYTPVVKFIIDNQAVDMIFVSMPFSLVIPVDFKILDPNILRGLDDAAVRCVHACVCLCVHSLARSLSTNTLTLLRPLPLRPTGASTARASPSASSRSCRAPKTSR